MKRKAEEELIRKVGGEDLPEEMNWSNHQGELLVMKHNGCQPSKKVIAFDMDSTLITTKSGRAFAVNKNDWQYLFDCIPEKMKELHDQGYTLVVLSNQLGVEKGKTTVNDIVSKFTKIIEGFNAPAHVICALREDHNRKPAVGMWTYLVEHLNNGIEPELSECAYVGDAAGRAKNWAPGKKKDFSCSDRKFAENVGMNFHTPEAFFLKEDEAPFTYDGWNPRELAKVDHHYSPKDIPLQSGSQEMVLMCGYPGSGKSFFAQNYFKDYVRVNRDTLKTMDKCAKAAKVAFEEGQSVVVDNINPGREARKPFINLAKQHKIPVKCVVMNVSREQATHMNIYRMLQSKGATARIPTIAYNMFKKKYEEPSKAEGIDTILTGHFKPVFSNEADESLFNSWM